MTSDSSNYAKTWELSLYELNRLPHDVIQDDTEIAVSPRSLHNELMCPICLDILKNTMTTKECLHRFCSDCIITALRAGNKECPTCRKKLISKRSLRRDPNFDSLIAKIYPNREEIDALHEKVLEKLNKKHLTSRQQSITTNNDGDTATTRQSRRKVKPQNNSEESQQSDDVNGASTSATPAAAATATASTSSSSNNNKNELSRKRIRTASDESDMESRTSTERSHTTQNDYDEVELILKPHPKETTHNSKRFLKTTSNATVSHLSKYLTTRLCLESTPITQSKQPNNETQDNFYIYINPLPPSPSSTTTTATLNQLQLLTSNTTLEQIVEKFWKQNKPLELQYTYKTPVATN